MATGLSHHGTALPDTGIEDMITLDNLTEETMLNNLKIRYQKNLIYTYTGSILISVNPFKLLPLYSNNVLSKYIGKRIGIEAPHIFAVADEAYRFMRDRSQNQAMIISGESGAGKTEATKLTLQYLATMTNKHSQVEQAILQSSPVLEAFGNAKTVRNNNSSRFGKLIEVHFDTGGFIAGARITQYLLEKSRIVSQAATERNYHIFYQLLAGASDDEKKKLKLRTPNDYRYLNQSGCTTLNGVDDEEQFQRTRMAMQLLGLNDTTQHTILAVLSAVLWIGNIEFAPAGESCTIKSDEPVKTAAALLGVDAGALSKALVARTMTVRGQNTTIPLKPPEAADTRDALAKTLYSRMFEWLVNSINKVILKPNTKNFIGVLDIFGFENFKVNSFEQLCINYTNEKLQLHFNEHIFKLEQEEYEREKIAWSKVDFKDNVECIDLIEKTSPPGLLALLDEECRFPKASDDTFLQKIATAHAGNRHFSKPKAARTNFIVKHYAGEVSYEIKDFLEKNRDTLQQDIAQVLLASSLEPVKQFIKLAVGDDPNKKPPTIGTAFKSQLAVLYQILSSCNAHYVRCIKPNALQAADTFDNDLVLAQLRYAGMLETVRIRRSGFPIRFTPNDFVKRYFILLDGFKPGKDTRAATEQMLSKFKFDKQACQLGLTKVFMKDFQYAALEDRRNERIAKKIIALQKWWRMKRARRRFLALRNASIIFEKFIRRYIYRRRFQRLRAAAIILQCVARMAPTKTKTWVALVAKREAERKRIEAERKRKEEEERRRQEELARMSEEQRKREIERRQREEEEERKRKAEEERKKKAEEERLKREEEAARFAPAPLSTSPRAPAKSVIGQRGAIDQDASASANPIDPAAAAGTTSMKNAIQEQFKINKEKWKPFKLLPGIQDPPPLVNEDMVPQYQRLEYANAHFRSLEPPRQSLLDTLTLRRRAAVTMQDQLQFTKRPLDLPLLAELPQPLHKNAVDIFKVILNYILMPAGSKEPWADIQEVLKRGILRAELRDEIYNQVIKQTDGAPNEVASRAWEWLAWCLGAFIPSPELQPYLAVYLFSNAHRPDKPIVRQWAAYCLRRLERAVMISTLKGAKSLYRVIQPSVHELSLVKQMAPIVLQIITTDGHKHDIEVDSATTVNEAMGILSAKLALQDSSFHAVYEVFTSIKDPNLKLDRSLFIDEFICDAYGKAEHAKTFAFHLQLRRKIYLEPEVLPDDPVELRLLYFQCCEEILDGRLPVRENDAVHLAAIRVKAEPVTPRSLDEWIPRPMVKRRAAKEWDSMIRNSATKLMASSAQEAQWQYLDYASKLPFFGSALFPVENQGDRNLPATFDIMINIKGVHFVKNEADFKKVFLSVFHSEVKIDYTASAVTLAYQLEGQSPKSLDVNSKKGTEINSVYREYFYWLQAQSEWARAIQEYKVDDPNLLSFNKGDIIHVLEKDDPEWFMGEMKGKRGSFPSNLVVLFLRPPPEATGGRDARKRAPTAKMTPEELAQYKAQGGGGGGEHGRRTRTGSIMTKRSEVDTRDRSSTRNRASSKPVRPDSPGVAAAAPAKDRYNPTLWEQYKVDPARYRFEEFARQFFRAIIAPGTGTLRKGPSLSPRGGAPSPHDLALFSRDPLKDSLLVLDLNAARMALDIFRAVMKYMEDLPRGKMSDVELVQIIMQYGLDRPEFDMSVPQQMTFADEIYCQIMKQCNSNPRAESLTKGFELLSICCGMFLPCEALFPYIIAFAMNACEAYANNEAVVNLARDCLDRIAMQKQLPETMVRRLPPSSQEIMAVVTGGQMQQLVYFTNSQSKVIDIDSLTTVQDLIDQLGEAKRFKGWALFEVLLAGELYMENPLKADEMVCDVLSRWEKFQPPAKVEGELVFQFMWKKHIFLKSDRDEQNPLSLSMLYHQMVGSVNRGQIPSTEEEAAYLAGLQLRHDNTTQAQAQAALQEMAERFLPAHYVVRVPAKTKGTLGPLAPSLIQQCMVSFQQFSNAKPAAVELAYLSKVKTLPLYGCSLFNVQYGAQKKKLRPCLLALSETSIQIWEVGPGQKAPARSLEYAEIASWGPKPGSLSIISGNLVNPTLDVVETAESYEIAEVIKAYKAAKAEAVLDSRRAFL